MDFPLWAVLPVVFATFRAKEQVNDERGDGDTFQTSEVPALGGLG